MELIKSVRVRKSIPNSGESNGSGDIQVSLFKERKFLRTIRTIKGLQDNRVIWTDSEYGGERYDNKSDDFIINDFIRLNTINSGYPENIKNNNNELVSYYKIIQDPWIDGKPPTIRNFGYDPYYINNGASIYIEWSGTSGDVWSDIDGNELQYESMLRDSLYRKGNTQSASIDANNLWLKKINGRKSLFCVYNRNGKNDKFYLLSEDDTNSIDVTSSKLYILDIMGKSMR